MPLSMAYLNLQPVVEEEELHLPFSLQVRGTTLGIIANGIAADSSPSPTHSPLANTMMTFIVRGLFSSLQYPYAQFPCSSLTGDQLFEPFWKAVSQLERLGFKVCHAL